MEVRIQEGQGRLLLSATLLALPLQARGRSIIDLNSEENVAAIVAIAAILVTVTRILILLIFLALRRLAGALLDRLPVSGPEFSGPLIVQD